MLRGRNAVEKHRFKTRRDLLSSRDSEGKQLRSFFVFKRQRESYSIVYDPEYPMNASILSQKVMLKGRLNFRFNLDAVVMQRLQQ